MTVSRGVPHERRARRGGGKLREAGSWIEPRLEYEVRARQDKNGVVGASSLAVLCNRSGTPTHLVKSAVGHLPALKFVLIQLNLYVHNIYASAKTGHAGVELLRLGEAAPCLPSRRELLAQQDVEEHVDRPVRYGVAQAIGHFGHVDEASCSTSHA